MPTLSFARKATDQTRRDLKFISALQRKVAVHLTEALPAASAVAPKVALWRTLRVRPEIIATIEGLQDRYAAQHNGRDLTTSEVIAAALTEALPIMTAREFR